MRIGAVDVGPPKGPILALAPMDDVTDLPFRRICKAQGADLVFTEFVQSDQLVHGAKRAEKRLDIAEDERPVGIQLYGSAESRMQQAALRAAEAGPDLIDINCGCWVKKIAGRGDGAGLLRDLAKFESVVRAVVEVSPVPVTIKTRLGWDDDNVVILEVARMVEQCGAAALTVHCRTRKQGYAGEADWSWLARIREATSLPLIGNGDVRTAEDARRMLESGCDGVMIGRGAIHNPWIFAQTRHLLDTGASLPPPDATTRIAMCIALLRETAAYRGEARAVREFRKHYRGYLGDLPGFDALRPELMTIEREADARDRLAAYAASLGAAFDAVSSYSGGSSAR